MVLDPAASRGPLHRLRVVDSTHTADAVLASTLLGDLGADVVQLEVGPEGHPARRVGPLKGGASLLWKATGRNKRAVRLTNESTDPRGWLDSVLDRADALVAARDVPLPDGTTVPVADIARRHPHLVVLDVGSYATDGPLRDRPPSGRVAEAFGGQTFAAGEPDRPPLHSGFPIGAATTALFGALGVVAGVLERDRNGSGDGQVVELAGYEAVLRVMEFLPIFFQQTGFRNERAGNGSSYQVPVATWMTADDKWVTFTGNTDEIVHRLYRAMGRPELIDDPRFATNAARVEHRNVVEPLLRDWAQSLTRAALEEVCEAHNVPLGVVFAMDDIFADANVLARGSIAEVDDDALGKCRVPTAVPRFSESRTRVHHLGSDAVCDPRPHDVWPTARTPMHGRERNARAPRGAGPLAGLRVIDMGQILAGPFAATLLADLGADVVKVEKRHGGDDFRRQAPVHDGVSLWWKASGRNKRSIALDLKDSADRDVFLGLVHAADVVFANFVPGTLERMGLGYDTLRAVNPDIVLVSVSGFGQDGPYRTRRAFGRNAEAYGGLASVTGYADSAPMPTGFPVADGLSALFGALGALGALYRQMDDDGARGEHVDVALYETVFRFLELHALVYDQFGSVPAASSFGSTAGEIFCVAQSADGTWMSASGWHQGPVTFTAGDPAGVAGGTSRADDVERLRAHVAASTCDELLAAPEHPLGVAVTRVSSIDELFTDPWGPASASLLSIVDGELGQVALAPVVPRFRRTPGRVASAAPRLDAHREAICSEWLADGATRHDVDSAAAKERA
jgi:crotonobetainyl-CoA:carnitine CoA-transferase CaiB-like acyl-CoA transferase